MSRTARPLPPTLHMARWALRMGAAVMLMSLGASPGAFAAATTSPALAERRAEFGKTTPSTEVRMVADGIVKSGDNAGAHFIILDKVRARVYVFTPAGRLLAHAPALLGIAKGDHTVPGIGEKKLSEITPDERTTPAGRFVAEMGESSTRGEDVVWVDYDAAVSMHRVVTSNPRERRLQRLATPTPKDNRISYGCINLPKAFYEKWVGGTVSKTRTVIYVLPETQPPRELFSFLGRASKPVGTSSRTAARAKTSYAGPPRGLPMPVIGQ